MAEIEDERPPGEEEEEETDPESKVVAPVVQETSVSVDLVDLKAPGAAEEGVEIVDHEDKPGIDASSGQVTNQSEVQSSTPASTPQAAVSAPVETPASTASVDPYAGYAGYDPAAAGYDYSAYWAQYGYHSGYNYSGTSASQPLPGPLFLNFRLSCQMDYLQKPPHAEEVSEHHVLGQQCQA